MSSVPLPRPTPHTDQFVQLHGMRWTDFEILLALRGDRSAPRLAYIDGTIELMSPSLYHERIKTLLGRLLEAWAEEHGIPLDGYGSWTLKDPMRERGLEPDECYVVGRAPGERPDLAIEVVWTSGGIDELRIYAGLHVPEVWRWEEGELTVYLLQADRYTPADRSALFPELDLREMARHLDAEDQTAAVRAWRAALRAPTTSG